VQFGLEFESVEGEKIAVNVDLITSVSPAGSLANTTRITFGAGGAQVIEAEYHEALQRLSDV
jgi:hypothetical protein